MADTTKIQWTDATFNIAWGCTKIAAGCLHCYAERDSKRYGFSVWGPASERRTFSEKHWTDPIKWAEAWAREHPERPMRIFTSSMADVFEDHPTIDRERAKLRRLVERLPNVQWQILTKRGQRMWERWYAEDWHKARNVWAMVSVAEQKDADLLIPHLLAVDAAVRGVSYEPAIGPVDFTHALYSGECGRHACAKGKIDWLIVGGESGHHARPFDVNWARSTIRACKAAGVACFVKQLGARPYTSGPARDDDVMTALKDRKGGDWDEWPEDLRVREFPVVTQEVAR